MRAPLRVRIDATAMIAAFVHSPRGIDAARIRAEFPVLDVRVDPPRGLRLFGVDARAWARDELDALDLDRRLDDALGAEPVALQLAGAPASADTDAALALLTRYQCAIDRRNDASATPLFDRVLERHRELHDLSLPLVKADWLHARDAWQWTLRLAPDASLAVQIAAFFHDIERLATEARTRVEHHAPDYGAFKAAHARGGAVMTRMALAAIVPPEILARVEVLVRGHESPGEDPELALLNDADALSFFSRNSAGFLAWYGRPHTARKIDYTLARISPAARSRLAAIRLAPALRDMIDAALAKERK